MTQTNFLPKWRVVIMADGRLREKLFRSYKEVENDPVFAGVVRNKDRFHYVAKTGGSGDLLITKLR